MNEHVTPRHLGEFARAISQHQYEEGPEGLLLPAAKVYVRGVYSHRLRRRGEPPEPWVHTPNLLPTEGINTMLDNLVAAGGVAAYISLYAANISPTAAWTAASYPATASEITSGSEGYSEGTRQAWTTVAAASGSKDNYASPATFTIVTATSLSVNGVGLHTVSTKGGTTGKLLSATKFGSTRQFANTDEFDVKYRITITSS